MDGFVHRMEMDIGFQVFKNRIEAFDLLLILREDVIIDFMFGVFIEVLYQQFEVFVEIGLRSCCKNNFFIKRKWLDIVRKAKNVT